jgi:hypothetical protein
MCEYEYAMIDFEQRDLERDPALRDAPQWVKDSILEYRSLPLEERQERDEQINESVRAQNARLQTRSLPFEEMLEVEGGRPPVRGIRRRY